MEFKTIIVIILTFVCVNGLDDPGPYNTHYTIPFYYGSRMDERNSKSVILYDVPTNFFWSYTFNVDYLNNLWVADANRSSILYISKEAATWNAYFKVAGVEYTKGYREGNIDKAIFNNPTSVCVYAANRTKILLARTVQPIYLFENSTSDLNCLKYMTKDNYTSCGTLIYDDTYDLLL